MTRKTALLTIGLGLLVLTVATLLSGAETRAAAPESVPVQNSQQEAPQKLSNAYCLLCHAKPDRIWKLPSGETLSLTVDPTVLAKSVHGDSNAKGALACADCHVDYSYPHPVETSQTARDFTLGRYAACRSCHQDQYTRAQDSVHGAALRTGRREAAVCIDCHGAHDIQPPDKPRQRISLTCGKCHGAIFDQYRSSVHGAALLTENNPDVPTCIDCHGVHDIQNPTTSLFRVRSPELCSKCHANNDLMTKYKISTRVHDSYLTDFHGSTVALFEQEDPRVPTNKAVCYDCHGVHNIQPVKNGNLEPVRENLLTACKQCHPTATTNFPDAWIGHYAATAGAHPLLFGVTGLLNLLVPGVVGILGVLVGTDLFRRIRRLLGRNSHRGA